MDSFRRTSITTSGFDHTQMLPHQSSVATTINRLLASKQTSLEKRARYTYIHIYMRKENKRKKRTMERIYFSNGVIGQWPSCSYKQQIGCNHYAYHHQNSCAVICIISLKLRQIHLGLNRASDSNETKTKTYRGESHSGAMQANSCNIS